MANREVMHFPSTLLNADREMLLKCLLKMGVFLSLFSVKSILY